MDTFAPLIDQVSYTIRPRVHEVDLGEYRGCVEVIGRVSDRIISFTRFCDILRHNRELADYDAMRLSQRLCETELREGKCWISPGQIGGHGEQGLLADVPSSLLVRSPSAHEVPQRKRHLRIVA